MLWRAVNVITELNWLCQNKSLWSGMQQNPFIYLGLNQFSPTIIVDDAYSHVSEWDAPTGSGSCYRSQLRRLYCELLIVCAGVTCGLFWAQSKDKSRKVYCSDRKIQARHVRSDISLKRRLARDDFEENEIKTTLCLSHDFLGMREILTMGLILTRKSE